MARANLGIVQRAARPAARLMKLLMRLAATALIVGGGLRASEDSMNRMAAVLSYTGLDNPAPTDVGRLVELWNRAQQAGLPSSDRRAAFRDMYILYYKLHGRDLTAQPQALDGLAQTAATIYENGGRFDISLPKDRGKPSGSYLHVEKRGNGPVPLLLISDLGVDGRKLYESFAARQAGVYTMRIVTLPYAGSARPLPWPERIDVTARPWLTAIENELLTMIDDPSMAGATVIGTSGGGYFAARLAVLRPQRIRAAVLVNALARTPMRSVADPDAPASPAERALRSKTVIPGPQLFPIAPLPPPEELRRLIDNPQSLHPIGRNWMSFAVKDPAVSREWTYQALSSGYFIPSQVYGWELGSTDLTDQMKSLTRPVLAMASLPDEGSPRVAMPTISQWEETKLRYPHIPLTIATFADTRTYISADAPEEFDCALTDFLAGRPVNGKDHFSLPRTSPRASVKQAVGGADIVIDYGRPASKDRKLWGSLVPNGRVWRAGANEASRFTFTRDVKIEGHVLPAGTYSFFVIPRDTEWTVIFNRVPRQWGAFDYDPSFDALRFTVKPSQAAHQEYLSYRLEPAGASSATVTMTWGQLTVTFGLEVPA